ncbi:MAG: DUF547 domain-containing protein [Flavobacteriales bacterium]|nr:DUF547 domain-containing protein [Flavobacteriales bacterium]
MNKVLSILICLSFLNSSAQNVACSMAEMMAYNARFNPDDNRQKEIVANLKPEFLIQYLKTEEDKKAFWLNVYNSSMLIFLRDTLFEGEYKNFYKEKAVTVAGKRLSLFEIEHEFLLGGKKMKKLGFKKSSIDTVWKKLSLKNPDLKVLLCMYRGQSGYPPYQVINSGDLQEAFNGSYPYVVTVSEGKAAVKDWLKRYTTYFKDFETTLRLTKGKYFFDRTPEAVCIKNFYPAYEGVKFKEEEVNPWLKK